MLLLCVGPLSVFVNQLHSETKAEMVDNLKHQLYTNVTVTEI